jgi:hypothetical protein
MRAGGLSALAIGLAMAACAGRDPEPIATVQPWDQTASCTQIRAEIEANNIKVKELADEQGWKAAQNVVTGVGGLLIPVLWFGMDWKGSASKDVAALQARQQYLTTLATEKCAQASAPAQASPPKPDTKQRRQTAQAPAQPDKTAQAPAQPDKTAQAPAQPDLRQ